jgi:hypothetical protein
VYLKETLFVDLVEKKNGLRRVTFYPNTPKYTQIYPNTASNYIISIILRCFMNN